MSTHIVEIGGTRVLEVEVDGPALASEQDAVGLVGEALGGGADLVAVPVARLADDFFELRNQKAGLFVQKLVNYRLRLAILGDIERHMAASEALRDFVRESNRGASVWFVADRAALEAKLTA